MGAYWFGALSAVCIRWALLIFNVRPNDNE